METSALSLALALMLSPLLWGPSLHAAARVGAECTPLESTPPNCSTRALYYANATKGASLGLGNLDD
jgi:hypothetical protein